jgi:hypothetical protein
MDLGRLPIARMPKFIEWASLTSEQKLGMTGIKSR